MDERDWTDRPLAIGAQLDVTGCTVTRMDSATQSLISGALGAALDALAPGAPMLGFAGDASGGEITEAPAHAIRIARDHALLVTPTPLVAAPGWHALGSGSGFALSPAGPRFVPLRLAGQGARDVLAQGMMSAPPWGSPSAAVHFAGVPALVTGHPACLTLWVESAHLTFVTSFLRAMAPTQPA